MWVVPVHESGAMKKCLSTSIRKDERMSLVEVDAVILYFGLLFCMIAGFVLGIVSRRLFDAKYKKEG